MFIIIQCIDCKKTSVIDVDLKINVIHCPECKGYNITYLDIER